jgi:hypothetical protein
MTADEAGPACNSNGKARVPRKRMALARSFIHQEIPIKINGSPAVSIPKNKCANTLAPTPEYFVSAKHND